MPPELAAEPVSGGRSAGTTLVIACGALVREVRAVADVDSLGLFDVHYLPAPLHNRPEQIAPAVRSVIEARPADVDRILVGYADCGSGGVLDTTLDHLRAEHDLEIERLPGNHCYEFFAGADVFGPLHAAELGTFFLTDYLARHFDQLIWRALKLDRHPELLPMLFGNYTRVLYLSQTDDPNVRAELTEMARAAADRLGLAFATHHTGLGPFRQTLVELSGVAERSR